MKKENALCNEVRMPWMALAFSFIFIFNPNISILDALPDFIGYIILSVGLTKLSMLNDTISEAKRIFEKMILIDASKLLLVLFVFGIDSAAEKASSLLLWSFAVGVVELIFVIPAYLKLFKGLSEIGDFFENTSIHGKKRRAKKSYTDSAKDMAVSFAVFKAIMTVLPELSDLSNGGASSNGIYRYIWIMRLLCMVPIALFGILLLVKMFGYFGRISHDEALNNEISEKYRVQVLPKRGRFIISNIRTASWFTVAAVVMVLDFTLEGVNILPDVFAPIFLLVAVKYLSRDTDIKKKGIYTLISIYAVIAAVTYAVKYYFENNYSYNAIAKNSVAFSVYMTSVILTALQGIMLVLTLYSFFKIIRSVIHKHTGYVLGREQHTEAEERQVKAFQDEIAKCFIWVIDVAVLCVISDTAYSLYGAVYAFLRKNIGYLRPINIAVGILFVAVMVRATDELKNSVRTKYMLE